MIIRYGKSKRFFLKVVEDVSHGSKCDAITSDKTAVMSATIDADGSAARPLATITHAESLQVIATGQRQRRLAQQ